MTLVGTCTGQRVLGPRNKGADKVGRGRQVDDEIDGLTGPGRRWQQIASRHAILICRFGGVIRGEFIFPTPPPLKERVAQGASRILRRPAGAAGDIEHPAALVSSPCPSISALLVAGATSASMVAWKRRPGGSTQREGGGKAAPVDDLCRYMAIRHCDVSLAVQEDNGRVVDRRP